MRRRSGLPQKSAHRICKNLFDKETFQILRNENRGIPIEGYVDGLKDCVELNVTFQFVMTFE